MIRFSELPIERLLDPKGYACNCGLHHVCDLRHFKCGAGVIAQVPQVVRDMGYTYPFVVCDPNTYEAAGAQVVKLLEAAGIQYKLFIVPQKGEKVEPDEWSVGAVTMALDVNCDMFLCVGSGVLNDVCKVSSFAAGKPQMVVVTAPSMDGYASSSSSMHVNDVKTTLYNHCPVAIIADTDIVANAPMRMLWSGFGDMIAKYVATCEWRIAHLIVGEYYCEEVASLMRRALKAIVDNADKLSGRDPQVIQAITEGLVLAGIAMSYAQVSRPASGLEHYFSHMWEMIGPERGVTPDFHGIQVGVGTLQSLKLYDWIRTLKPTRERGLAHMAAFDRGAWEDMVRDIFGQSAPQILAVEEKAKKNDPVQHRKRLDRIVDNWDKILAIIEEELPETSVIEGIMKELGMPMVAADLGWDEKGAKDAYTGSREIRDKYLTSSMLWDIGYAQEARDLVQAK
jgi:glycerol-1-phosphate dehydrogenase [NAD(P)+]